MTIWKLGCSWGDRSQAPVFYDLLKKYSIVICNSEPKIHRGDYVALAKGFDIFALAIILKDVEPASNHQELKSDFEEYDIGFDDSYIAKAKIFELNDSDHIWYQQQKSGRKISKEKILKQIKKLIYKMENEETTNKIIGLLKSNHNVILTGAPGTGKTYRAKEVAASIIGCETKDLGKNHQYGFVQFHPSYDYTDFVEGLRPLKSKESKDITFELKDGVFKKFCERALRNSDSYLFHSYYKGWIDKIEASDSKKITLNLKSEHSHQFSYTKNNGGFVLSSQEENDHEDYNITKEQLFKFLMKYHTLSSLLKDNDAIKNMKEELKGEKEKLASFYWAILKEMLPDTYENQNSDKYVFVIDEINRGELSKIFGELFFSIDPDYRGKIGAVQTQYANLQEKPNAFDEVLDVNEGDYGHFFVPENVYIIGTMNDIDRSVESMDFAMRRRFSWKEITADDSMLMLDNYFEGDELRKVQNRMKNLNDEILKIPGLSSAYQIGGAYFKKYKKYHDFDELWNNHLRGLLYEYLRGNRDIDSRLVQLKVAYDNEN